MLLSLLYVTGNIGSSHFAPPAVTPSPMPIMVQPEEEAPMQQVTHTVQSKTNSHLLNKTKRDLGYFIHFENI